MSAPPRVPPRMTFGVIGAGRVGTVLGAALVSAGHHLLAITPSSRPGRARALLPGVPVRPAAEIARTAPDLLLIAVPDDILGPLVATLPAGPAGQVVAHTSGAHGLAVLAPVAERGGHPLALHPAMTFTGEATDLTRLPGSSYGVTAPTPLRSLATRLIADLGGTPEWVADSARPLYHAALAHGANHLVTLVNEAAEQLRAAGVQQPERLLAPLLRAALENTLRWGDSALTGPVARGDAGTIARHLRVLAQTSPEAVAAYRALARRTADRAIGARLLSPATAEPLLAVLAEPTDRGEVADPAETAAPAGWPA